MEKIGVLIVEDKLIIAENIASLLRKHSLEVVAMCTTGEEAIDVAITRTPDLILMDIELAGAIDGISAAQLILRERSIPIIYLTDYTDSKTLERAKKTQPANYLGKPFNEIDLIRAIDIAFNNAKHSPIARNNETHVFMKKENQVYVKIGIQDILFLQADRAYCDVYTTTGIHKFSNSMNHIFEQLNHKDFVRVHRSYIVNIKRITALDGNVIRIADKEVQMGREFRDNVLGLLRIIK
jgi:DNA-binding LytR/AlgR family response regulator